MTVLTFKEKKKGYGCFTNLYSYHSSCLEILTGFKNLHDSHCSYLQDY